MKKICVLILMVLFFVLFTINPDPVRARPMADTYSNQPDETNAWDTVIESNNATTIFGGANVVIIGERDDLTSANNRTIIKFYLTSIPSNATITNATLSLWIKGDFSSNARDFKVYRVLRDWHEEYATWNVWDSASNWTTSGAGSDGNDTDLTTVWATTNFNATEAIDTQKNFSLDVTEVTKFINGTYANYGWLIKADTELNDAYSFYSSSELTKTTERPKLVINYTVPTNTPTNTATHTATATDTATATNTATATDTPIYTATFTDTPIFTPTFTETVTETFTPTASITPGGPTFTDTPVFIGTAYFDSRITYGEFAVTTALWCIGVLIFTLFLGWLLLFAFKKGK